MFVWLASYPKSGNTLVGSLLASYFFSKDGIFDFDLIKNIKQFPHAPLFESLGFDITNEKELLKNGKSACFLSLKINNLPELYSAFGINHGDLLQRGIASTISKILPSPKYIFKFSENTYIVILAEREWSEAQPFQIKLERILNNTPFFVEGKSMQISVELGMSYFPNNGKTISQLIGASLHKAS